MQLNNLALIAAAEVAAVLLIFCLILLYQNKKLRKLTQKFQVRMEQLVQELKLARQQKKPPPPPAPSPAPPTAFKDLLNDQIQLTKEHHASLGSEQDIVLDLAPDAELDKRAAALRYAMLLAEKEAWAQVEDGEPPKWEALKTKYQQIFSFYEDYHPAAEEVANHEDLDALNQELLNAKKRINNLEKFKALYFDLEEKWDSSKETAQTHYESLSKMADAVEDRDAFESALNSYQSAYGEINKLIEEGIGEKGSDIVSTTDEKSASELRHLRTVAADQHKIITELQEKLINAKSDEERTSFVEGLKDELSKQQRFVQESETCIQLMEDELGMANKEITQLKDRLKTLPSIKTQLSEAKSQRDQYELKVYSLTSENRKLNKKLQEEKGSTTADSGEAGRLKRELTDLETKYASLEEKYLNLKIQ
ncbi:hypothetical protein TDB9533_04316 [Thalassocella blandensis]|nr:hypothetical protein TDB9533_04316 [Thalassocella blandensis]